MKKTIINSLLGVLISVSPLFAQKTATDFTTPGKCLTYDASGSQAIFHCENNVNVMLKLCSPGIIKFWYEQGNFQRNNESFAVVNENIDNRGPLSVSEQPGSYEIFTSELILRINKNPFQVRIFDKYQKLLLEDFQGKGFIKEPQRQITYKTLRPNEHFFGLGEKSGGLDRRGKTFRMWNSDKPCYATDEDPLYKSIPFFMSNFGYGIFFDNTYKSVFNFGATSNEYYSFESPGGEMAYYFIFGPSYKQIIERYTQLTGKPILPPEWALGFSQCRGMYTNEKLAREVAGEFRKRQIPCDIIYQDIGWTQNLQDFEWRKENYENPRKMVADLAAQGFKMIVSQDPVISQDNKKQWREADSLGYLAKDIRTGKSYDMPWPWGGNCGVVDFSKPGVADWWGTYQQKVINDGVKGFWTDMGEPAWSNEEDVDRLNMKHHLGMHDEIHNVYGFIWDRAVTEQFEKHNPNKRVFQMTRACFAGMQRYTFAWSGDSGDGNDVANGWNKLAAQVLLGQSAGMGLIPFWTTDISGYCGDIKDRDAMAELYVRWMQFGVFNPLSRAHHEGNNAAEPWTFGSEAEKRCREAINLKYKLHPYMYTYAREAYDTGLPLMRALLLEYPDDAETFKLDGQFLFGKELLVAPVVEKDATEKQVYLPQGEWIDFNDGKTVYRGKQWITYPVTLSTIPLFVKRGSIIPQMPVQQYIGENKNTPVWFDVYPAAEGRSASFTLYEDDGESNDYKKDVCNRTDVKCQTEKDAYAICVQRRDDNRRVEATHKRNYGVKIRLEKIPAKVELNGAKLKFVSPEKMGKSWIELAGTAVASWDKDSHTLWLKWQDNGEKVEISIRK
jgi:Alpha-glucosidases, family 31 of glycosyl hydrolases